MMENNDELSVILDFVAKKYNTTISEIKGRHRSKKLVDVRDRYVWLAKFHSHDYEDIGKIINRDRSTVYTCHSRAMDERRIYPKCRKEYDDLKSEYDKLNVKF